MGNGSIKINQAPTSDGTYHRDVVISLAVKTDSPDSLVFWGGVDGSKANEAVVQMSRARSVSVLVNPQLPSTTTPTATPSPGTIYPTATPQPTPIPPHVLRGTVTLGGNAAVDGALVEAWVGDFKAASTTVVGGLYALVLSGAQGKSFAGESVQLRVNLLVAAESTTWQPGKGEELNLTVP